MYRWWTGPGEAVGTAAGTAVWTAGTNSPWRQALRTARGRWQYRQPVPGSAAGAGPLGQHGVNVLGFTGTVHAQRDGVTRIQ